MQGIMVKVSSLSARQLFKGCSVDYIRNVCKGRCCEGDHGISVTVHTIEQARIEGLGGIVINGLLQADQRGLCPFKGDDGLCVIHDKGKPLGCIASPFTLNPNSTLITRNRYRLLRCYKAGTIPAYKAFSASLIALFGNDEVITRLDSGEGDFRIMMPYMSYQILMDNTELRRHSHYEGQGLRQIPQRLPLF